MADLKVTLCESGGPVRSRSFSNSGKLEPPVSPRSSPKINGVPYDEPLSGLSPRVSPLSSPCGSPGSENLFLLVEPRCNAVPSPAKSRLEREAKEHIKPDPSSLQRALDEDLLKHSENRNRIIDGKVQKAHGEVEHAKEVAARHRKEIEQSVQSLRENIEEKQRWSDELRAQCINFRGNQGFNESIKAAILSEECRIHREEAIARLAQSLEKSQEIAAKNRAALERFKRTQAEFDVEHSQEIHDRIKAKKAEAIEKMEASLEQHLVTADMLRETLIRERAAKAQSEVEYAQLVHDLHDVEVANASADLSMEIEQKDLNAFSNRRQQINETSLKCHEEVAHAKEVALEKKGGYASSSEREDLFEVLDEKLRISCEHTIQHQVSLDDWFQDHMRQLDYEEPEAKGE